MTRVVLVVILTLAARPALAGPVPVVLDTDIGADVDDAFALALAIASPEIDIVGVTTVGRGGPPEPFVQHVRKDRDEDRAWLVGADDMAWEQE